MLEKLLIEAGKEIPRPFGIFLSGGLDSGILTALLKPDIALTVNFGDDPFYDELEYAEAITKELKIPHKILKPDVSDFKEVMTRAMPILGEVVNSVSIYPWYKAFEYAKNLGLKTMVGGEGSDETFGGYSRYLILKAIQELYELKSLQGYKPMLDSIFGSVVAVHSKLCGVEKKVLLKRYAEKKDRGIITQLGWAEFNESLEPIHQMELKFAKHFGIELFLPFYNKEVQKYGWSLDDKDKIVGEIRKLKVYEIARKYLPEKVWARKDKKGFVSPANELCGAKNKYDKTAYLKLQNEIVNNSNQL